MEFIPEKIDRYCRVHTSPEPDCLKKLNRETHAKVLMPRMLSGHLQGRFLALISRMLKPERVLEIGTFTGYSAICMAEGLAENGKLITIDNNEELRNMTLKAIQDAGFENKIELLTGDAPLLIPSLTGPFDLVFIDADKSNYSAYFDLVIDKVRTGGVILADNVLWNGKVMEPHIKPSDTDTIELIRFNQKIQNDSRVENMLLPLRDGIMMMVKVA
jgi:predicted O-methyltransferase YrrM